MFDGLVAWKENNKTTFHLLIPIPLLVKKNILKFPLGQDLVGGFPFLLQTFGSLPRNNKF